MFSGTLKLLSAAVEHDLKRKTESESWQREREIDALE